MEETAVKRILPALAVFVLALWTWRLAEGADWNEWRGPNRDSVDVQGPPLAGFSHKQGCWPV